MDNWSKENIYHMEYGLAYLIYVTFYIDRLLLSVVG